MLAAADVVGVVVAVLAVRGGRRFSFSLSLLCIFLFSPLLLLLLLLLLCLPSLSFPLSLLSLLFSSPSLGSFFLCFFFSALPCIYRKTGEGNVLGRPLLAAPSTTFQQIKSQASG